MVYYCKKYKMMLIITDQEEELSKLKKQVRDKII
jgi:hypothetical protein